MTNANENPLGLPVAWMNPNDVGHMTIVHPATTSAHTVPLVLATDYAALLAERDALRAEVERLTRALEATTHLWESAGTELNSAEARAERLAGSLRVAVDSDLGALWVWPESAREQWMRDARAAISAMEGRDRG